MTASTPHVALVGLPGAGKTTVGHLAATKLGVPFVDLDAELVARTGLTIAEQFARDGEAAFRAAEADLARELATRPAGILAPGGGWMANAAAVAALGAVHTIYLHVDPAVAARRLALDPTVRPLVAGTTDPVTALAALLARRHAVYAAADATLDTSARSAASVAADVAALVDAWRTGTPRATATAA